MFHRPPLNRFEPNLKEYFPMILTPRPQFQPCPKIPPYIWLQVPLVLSSRLTGSNPTFVSLTYRQPTFAANALLLQCSLQKRMIHTTIYYGQSFILSKGIKIIPNPPPPPPEAPLFRYPTLFLGSQNLPVSLRYKFHVHNNKPLQLFFSVILTYFVLARFLIFVLLQKISPFLRSFSILSGTTTLRTNRSLPSSLDNSLESGVFSACGGIHLWRHGTRDSQH